METQLELQRIWNDLVQAEIGPLLFRDSASRSRSIEAAKEILIRANVSLPVDHVDSNYSDCVSDKNTTYCADDGMDDDLSDRKTNHKGYESLSHIDRRRTSLFKVYPRMALKLFCFESATRNDRK
eukprot:657600_1